MGRVLLWLLAAACSAGLAIAGIWQLGQTHRTWAEADQATQATVAHALAGAIRQQGDEAQRLALRSAHHDILAQAMRQRADVLWQVARADISPARNDSARSSAKSRVRREREAAARDAQHQQTLSDTQATVASVLQQVMPQADGVVWMGVLHGDGAVVASEGQAITALMAGAGAGSKVARSDSGAVARAPGRIQLGHVFGNRRLLVQLRAGADRRVLLRRADGGDAILVVTGAPVSLGQERARDHAPDARVGPDGWVIVVEAVRSVPLPPGFEVDVRLGHTALMRTPPGAVEQWLREAVPVRPSSSGAIPVVAAQVGGGAAASRRDSASGEDLSSRFWLRPWFGGAAAEYGVQVVALPKVDGWLVVWRDRGVMHSAVALAQRGVVACVVLVVLLLAFWRWRYRRRLSHFAKVAQQASSGARPPFGHAATVAASQAASSTSLERKSSAPAPVPFVVEVSDASDGDEHGRVWMQDAPAPTAPSPAREEKPQGPVLLDDRTVVSEHTVLQPTPLYRPLFDTFVKARLQCGQDGKVSYARFVQQLEHTRAKVRTQHDCADVGFQVAVNDGRATVQVFPRAA